MTVIVLTLGILIAAILTACALFALIIAGVVLTDFHRTRARYMLNTGLIGIGIAAVFLFAAAIITIHTLTA